MSARQVPKQRYLAPKEAASFRQVLKLYETHQYKKALKVADTILKKYPEHGETLAMKGLIMTFTDQRAEGHELIKLGLRNDISSFICWHVYGLFNRTEKNYEEAAKCYQHALKYDPENGNILRDLALLQVQMRNLDGFISSRKQILSQRPEIRQNWTALAIGYALVKDYALAESILQKYEDAMIEAAKPDDIEHSELLLFKNWIIHQSGDVKRALEDLEKIADVVLDKLCVLEYRALYLLELGRSEEAARAYRKLINRNPDCKAYFEGLEKALKVTDDVPKRKALYAALAKQYKRSNVAKWNPLVFLTGQEFKEAVSEYLSGFLARGVPSAFVNLKPLYTDDSKVQAIEEFALKYLSTLTGVASNGSSSTSNGAKDTAEATPTTYLWTVFYLAQHYSKIGKQDVAMEYVEKAIAHTPTLVEAYMVKAKILKRSGDLQAAADTMNQAREIDLQDRFVNSKAGKYYMRANKNDEAVSTISLFTKNDGAGKGVGDLHEMQCIWFVTEQGEMFARQDKIGMALKRFHSVKKIVDDWWTDQFDFHQYATRQGTARTYIDLIRWEDSLYSQPFYTRAAEDAIKTYLSLHDTPKSARVAAELAGLSEEERKRVMKKLKRDRAKENKKLEAEKLSEKDDDPLGKNLENTTKPLEDAMVFYKPIKDLEAWKWLGEEIEKRKNAPVEAKTEATA
ncbi:putative acetyltransferase catalytic subunit [Myxozyma melibiosi]|uniref:Acetyltransferase catalytic subunit n=1 Tax=Myxozyma melibiosi TaxID=54550 RepID=A0ABR1F989_9ASCO